jgi:hypothetical protein
MASRKSLAAVRVIGQSTLRLLLVAIIGHVVWSLLPALAAVALVGVVAYVLLGRQMLSQSGSGMDRMLAANQADRMHTVRSIGQNLFTSWRPR